jgi:hypothetical protein
MCCIIATIQSGLHAKEGKLMHTGFDLGHTGNDNICALLTQSVSDLSHQNIGWVNGLIWLPLREVSVVAQMRRTVG